MVGFNILDFLGYIIFIIHLSPLEDRHSCKLTFFFCKAGLLPKLLIKFLSHSKLHSDTLTYEIYNIANFIP